MTNIARLWCIEARSQAMLLQQLHLLGGPAALQQLAAGRADRWQPSPGVGALDVDGVEVGDDGEEAVAPYSLLPGGIAAMDLHGVVMKRETCLGVVLGDELVTVRAQRAIRQAADDPDIRQLLLVIDSPGGTVDGTAELANTVASVAASKPVTVYASDCLCSAAYWIGSQATRIYANETAAVGSIGAYLVVDDWSERYATEGIKTHVIRSPAGAEAKGAGVEGAPVTDPQLATWQAEVNAINARLVAAVRRGRNLSEQQAKAVNTGEVWIGALAVEAGLIDGVTDLSTLIAELRGGQGAQASTPQRTASASVATSSTTSSAPSIPTVHTEPTMNATSTIQQPSTPPTQRMTAERARGIVDAIKGNHASMGGNVLARYDFAPRAATASPDAMTPAKARATVDAIRHHRADSGPLSSGSEGGGQAQAERLARKVARGELTEAQAELIARIATGRKLTV